MKFVYKNVKHLSQSFLGGTSESYQDYTWVQYCCTNLIRQWTNWSHSISLLFSWGLSMTCNQLPPIAPCHLVMPNTWREIRKYLHLFCVISFLECLLWRLPLKTWDCYIMSWKWLHNAVSQNNWITFVL